MNTIGNRLAQDAFDIYKKSEQDIDIITELSYSDYFGLLKEWNTLDYGSFRIMYQFGDVTYIRKLTKLERALK